MPEATFCSDTAQCYVIILTQLNVMSLYYLKLLYSVLMVTRVDDKVMDTVSGVIL